MLKVSESGFSFRVYINYAKFTDAGFYQVEVLDTVSNVKEETFFWLNVQGKEYLRATVSL